MSVSDLVPKLPSGQQMVENGLPTAVQEQLRAIALQVLQRLFVPILRRRHLRKARLALTHELLSSHVSLQEVEAAAFSALQYTSYLGAVTRDFYTRADGSRFSTLGGTAEAETAAVVVPSLDAATGAAIRDTVRDILNSSYVQLSVHLQDEILEWEWEPASEVLVLVGGSLERRGTAVALKATASAGGLPNISPGVSVLCSRRASAMAGYGFSRRDSATTGGASQLGTARRASATMHLSTSSHGGSVGGSFAVRPTSAFLRRSLTDFGQDHAACASAMGGTAGAPTTPNSAVLRAPPSAPAPADAGVEFLTAPQVLGELACIGNFPYCAALCVSSPTAVILRMPKVIYCYMVSECASSAGQQRLLVEAMQMRERLLPYFAPLTRARLQICPLLTRLRTEYLEHIRDLMIPRVYAAGMECGEKEQPTHIFFIRRGVVQMQREASVQGNDSGAPSRNNSEPASPIAATPAATPYTNFSLELPRNRSVLVEGHTYGETSCILADTVGDRYTAVTHVDMYLLPFQVLIQLMKQEPEVHSAIYHSAQEFSYLRDKEWAGVLFGPRLVGAKLFGVHGVVPAEGMLALMATATHERASGGGPRDYRGKALAESPFSVDHPSHGSARRGGGGGGHRSSAPARRVTIFEEALNSGGTGDHAGSGVGGANVLPLTGGRVSSALLNAMEQMPLVSLLPSATRDFYRACTQQWRCVPYKKGDVIVTSGAECNRLLLFFEGRAGIVMNAPLLHDEMRSGPLGRADIASASPAAVCPIPPGHVVGYTCVRRHRWTRSIIALDNVVEVWEMHRNAFVQLLRTHGLERGMQAATLQVLQPLAPQERLAVLDYQPLLHPMPSSLWSEQAVPNVHPVVVTNESAVCFPVWREGDFPLDRHQSVMDTTARAGSAGARRATLLSASSMKVASVANERQRSASRLEDSTHLRSRHSGSTAGMAEVESTSRHHFIAQLAGA
ncbi:Cyclic_nucleotide-binding_domain_containing_protein [Leishmania braziliensis MHOM/BR/75/M2904]|nr:Cyclic_nucleotide-binding_domain_containing_protein [Leishmania braziliensis MHOM/BR/75/M2904]